MRTVVSIHNAVNERAWSEVRQGLCWVCVPTWFGRHEGNMRTVVSIHNAVNERAWSEVRQGFCRVCVPARPEPCSRVDP